MALEGAALDSGHGGGRLGEEEIAAHRRACDRDSLEALFKALPADWPHIEETAGTSEDQAAAPSLALVESDDEDTSSLARAWMLRIRALQRSPTPVSETGGGYETSPDTPSSALSSHNTPQFPDRNLPQVRAHDFAVRVLFCKGCKFFWRMRARARRWQRRARAPRIRHWPEEGRRR